MDGARILLFYRKRLVMFALLTRGIELNGKTQEEIGEGYKF